MLHTNLASTTIWKVEVPTSRVAELLLRWQKSLESRPWESRAIARGKAEHSGLKQLLLLLSLGSSLHSVNHQSQFQLQVVSMFIYLREYFSLSSE